MKHHYAAFNLVTSGRPVFVRPEQVAAFYEKQDETVVIILVGGNKVHVQQAFYLVKTHLMEY